MLSPLGTRRESSPCQATYFADRRVLFEQFIQQCAAQKSPSHFVQQIRWTSYSSIKIEDHISLKYFQSKLLRETRVKRQNDYAF